MKNTTNQMILVGVGAILFNLFFWNENLGLNLILYASFVIGANLVQNKEKLNLGARITLVGSFVSLVSFLRIHSTNSLLASLLSLILFTGFVHHSSLRSNWYSFLTVFIHFFKRPRLKINSLIGKEKAIRFKRILKLAIVPLIVVVVFVLIFRSANPIFDDIITHVESFFYSFFKKISITRILFFVVGLFITSALIVKGTKLYFVKKEQSKKTDITRENKRKRTYFTWKNDIGESKMVKKYTSFPILGLKNEHISSIILLRLIAVLLFIVNAIDIIYIWFEKEFTTTKSLTQMVHEGTYLLIFSILLAIFIMLYIFRKNQNFYPNNKKLKRLAYVWIIQNIVLVISVAIRNYNYISAYGLTRKRIGVYIFLVLTVIGLFFLYLKIANKKSTFYLFLQMGRAFYIALVLMTLVNWDALIVTYNINNVETSKIDYAYLLTLSDNSLITIDKNKNSINTKDWNSPIYIERYKEISPKVYFKQRIDRLKTSLPSSILSWNYADYNIKKYFK